MLFDRYRWRAPPTSSHVGRSGGRHAAVLGGASPRWLRRARRLHDRAGSLQVQPARPRRGRATPLAAVCDVRARYTVREDFVRRSHYTPRALFTSQPGGRGADRWARRSMYSHTPRQSHLLTTSPSPSRLTLTRTLTRTLTLTPPSPEPEPYPNPSWAVREMQERARRGGSDAGALACVSRQVSRT